MSVQETVHNSNSQAYLSCKIKLYFNTATLIMNSDGQICTAYLDYHIEIRLYIFIYNIFTSQDKMRYLRVTRITGN